MRPLQGAISDVSDERKRARAWWRRAVIYHVYLPSFRDSGADAMGDLGGLTDALPPAALTASREPSVLNNRIPRRLTLLVVPE